MSETTETTTTENEAAADKRERRTFPIRVLSQEPSGGWALVKDVEPFATIDAAEKWIERSGKEGTPYMMARVIGAKRRPPSKLEDVAI